MPIKRTTHTRARAVLTLGHVRADMLHKRQRTRGHNNLAAHAGIGGLCHLSEGAFTFAGIQEVAPTPVYQPQYSIGEQIYTHQDFLNTSLLHLQDFHTNLLNALDVS